MTKTASQAMKYEDIKKLSASKRRTIELGQFKDMKTSSIVFGAVRELYRRGQLEIWIAIACLEFAWIIWDKLG